MQGLIWLHFFHKLLIIIYVLDILIFIYAQWIKVSQFLLASCFRIILLFLYIFIILGVLIWAIYGLIDKCGYVLICVIFRAPFIASFLCIVTTLHRRWWLRFDSKDCIIPSALTVDVSPIYQISWYCFFLLNASNIWGVWLIIKITFATSITAY